MSETTRVVIPYESMDPLAIGATDDEIAKERSRVATEGAGARLLALQGADGSWGGGAFNYRNNCFYIPNGNRSTNLSKQ